MNHDDDIVGVVMLCLIITPYVSNVLVNFLMNLRVMFGKLGFLFHQSII